MGNLKAMEKMADALLFGNFGMQNITAAIQLYESLAKEGSYKAQNVSFERKSYLKQLPPEIAIDKSHVRGAEPLLHKPGPRKVTVMP